jgi:ferredoxin--NADP+ reductase
MFKIIEKRALADNIYLLRIEAPRVAQSALPGQFVIVRVDEQGERVPLTIADYDKTDGTVTIVIQTIGVSTRKLCVLNEGDYIADFAGPLGNPSEFIHLSKEELESRRYLL